MIVSFHSDPYRTEFKSMSLNFKFPMLSSVLEGVYCASRRYSMTLTTMIQQAYNFPCRGKTYTMLSI